MINQAVVRVESPEEREYARYLREIDARKQTIAGLRTDLASLMSALTRFEIEYNARVGVLFIDLDRTRLSITDYERRIAALQANPAADPQQVEAEVAAATNAQREEIDAQAEQNRRYEDAFARVRERPALDEDTELERRALFRDLAKRFHPDLARTETERLQRERVMQQINAAFQEHDLVAMRQLAQEIEFLDPEFEGRAIGDKLVWSIREVARLEEVIALLETERIAVCASDTHTLWQGQEEGEDVLEKLEAELNELLQVESERLSALFDVYRQLLEE